MAGCGGDDDNRAVAPGRFHCAARSICVLSASSERVVGPFLLKRALHSRRGPTLLSLPLCRPSPTCPEIPLSSCPPGATAGDAAVLRRALGLDRPMSCPEYLGFLSRAIRGDLGQSIRYRASNLQLILGRLPATLLLTSIALLLALLVALPVGVMSALHRNGPIDAFGKLVALVGQAVPFFWMALMLILLFSLRLDLFPTSGYGTFAHVVLPAVTLSLGPMARMMRLLRASMLEVLSLDYVRTAHQRAPRERRRCQARPSERLATSRDGSRAANRNVAQRGRHHRKHFRVAGATGARAASRVGIVHRPGPGPGRGISVWMARMDFSADCAEDW